MSTKPRIAFVVQRCGHEVNGGAELLCLQIARQMSPHWTVEILTTCALDYVTWANHFPPGDETNGRVTIRRFPVATQRDTASFDALSARLHPRQRYCTLAEQQEWMHAQGPVSPALTDYIREHRNGYAAFIFFGYLYATTFDNLPLVADKAWLVPCTHDEWPVYFSMFDRLFALPRGFVFNTAAERDFTRERFFHLNIEGPVAGVGIQAPAVVNADRFRRKYRLATPFLLYCGRIDPSKGCEEMFAAYLEWKGSRAQLHKLVLIGKPVMPIPAHPDIVSLGFVPEADKWDAMAACSWMLMPSRYESLSMVLLEAWAVGRPALVNSACQVLVDHCRQSRGGIAFTDWQEAFAAITICSPTEATRLGASGRDYVKAKYAWGDIIAKYCSILNGV